MNIVNSLIFIQNKGHCSSTLHRARQELSKIKTCLHPEEVTCITQFLDDMDVQNPDVWEPLGYRTDDCNTLLFYTREEFSRYMKTLIDSYRGVKNETLDR